MIPKFFKKKEVQREVVSKKLPTAKRIENIAHEIDSKLQKGMVFKHTTKQKYEDIYKKEIFRLVESQHLTKEDEKDLVFIMKTLLKGMYNPEEERAKNEVRDKINSLKHTLSNDGFFEDLDY